MPRIGSKVNGRHARVNRRRLRVDERHTRFGQQRARDRIRIGVLVDDPLDAGADQRSLEQFTHGSWVQ